MMILVRCGAVALLLASAAVAAQAGPDARAAATEARMTDDERFQILHGIMPVALPGVDIDPASYKGVPAIAGYVRGVPRLGIPDLLETDASLGVANPFQLRQDRTTAFPSSLALAATFDPSLAYAGGAAMGAETRALGYNVLLGGGVNLARDPRNGRNFEYLGEDPLLAGTMAGEAIRGTQSRGVVSTVKHFSLNGQETLRNTLDARIDEAAHRESDLLAFRIAIERGQPGSVMCAYNKVNGSHACGSDHLLNGVLKRDWGYPGWVMSDWGAVGDVGYFAAGLDQQSGGQLDKQMWFDAPLRAEVAAGRVPRARVSDAVRRILRSIYAVGADRADRPAADYDANARIARDVAATGIVLLKNDGALPLAASARSIVVIGGYADLGVMSGGGSSQVMPAGGPAAVIPVGGEGIAAAFGKQVIVPSSPLKALRAALPQARFTFDGGYQADSAAAAAAKADVAIVFATQWQMEFRDAGSMALPQGQDALIAAVARANPNTIVVLETGNPVRLPWLGEVKAVVEAWYPGQGGGEAIADVLTGRVNPSGRLPLSWPVDETQNPRPHIAGLGNPEGTAVTVDYPEGADVGYRWFAAHGQVPVFPFGHGLSYTRFGYSDVRVTGGRTVTARVTVTNTGSTAGADVPQLYLARYGDAPMARLLAFQRVELAPGESRQVTLTADRRLLARFDTAARRWRIQRGRYTVGVGRSATDMADTRLVELAGGSFGERIGR